MGQRYKYVIALDAWLAAFTCFWTCNAASVITPYLIEHAIIKPEDPALWMAFTILTLGIFAIPAGIMGDKWGASKFVALGILLNAIGNAGFVFSVGNVIMQWIMRAIIGLGFCFIFTNAPTPLGAWFSPKEVGLWIGGYVAFYSVGSTGVVVWPPFVLETLGWEWVFYIVSIVDLIIFVVYLATSRDKPTKVGVNK